MSAAYLVDNPPRRSQYRRPRRAKPTGAIVVHSTESLADVRPPDTGAENVASFIRNRTDAGSYHVLCDSDSRIRLVPFECEAFGDGTGSNPWAVHISGAFQANQWRDLPKWWRDGCVTQMAAAAREAATWLRIVHGIDVPARRISRIQSEQGMAGFISHGERDPGRRSDPGAWFPWDQFLDLYAPRSNQEDELMDPRALVVLTYITCLGRKPESLKTIDDSVRAIRNHPGGEREGQNAFVASVANSEEATAYLGRP